MLCKVKVAMSTADKGVTPTTSKIYKCLQMGGLISFQMYFRKSNPKEFACLFKIF